jgi:type I restriction enzyme R subunit
MTVTSTERLPFLPACQEHILQLENGKVLSPHVVADLSHAFALCSATDEATAIGQLVSQAITTDGQVIEVIIATGLAKPQISILSDQFLAEVRGLKQNNVVPDLLEKLLTDEISVRSERKLVQSQAFSEKLKRSRNVYPNRAFTTTEKLEELVALAMTFDAAGN